MGTKLFHNEHQDELDKMMIATGLTKAEILYRLGRKDEVLNAIENAHESIIFFLHTAKSGTEIQKAVFEKTIDLIQNGDSEILKKFHSIKRTLDYKIFNGTNLLLSFTERFLEVITEPQYMSLLFRYIQRYFPDNKPLQVKCLKKNITLIDNIDLLIELDEKVTLTKFRCKSFQLNRWFELVESLEDIHKLSCSKSLNPNLRGKVLKRWEEIAFNTTSSLNMELRLDKISSFPYRSKAQGKLLRSILDSNQTTLKNLIKVQHWLSEFPGLVPTFNQKAFNLVTDRFKSNIDLKDCLALFSISRSDLGAVNKIISEKLYGSFLGEIKKLTDSDMIYSLHRNLSKVSINLRSELSSIIDQRIFYCIEHAENLEELKKYNIFYSYGEEYGKSYKTKELDLTLSEFENCSFPEEVQTLFNKENYGKIGKVLFEKIYARIVNEN